MFKDVAELIYFELVDSEITEKRIEVFVNKKSVARQEFYASYQIGVNPTCVFEMRVEDFEMSKTIEQGTNRPQYATKILYEDAEYNIIRTYEKADGMIELTCD